MFFPVGKIAEKAVCRSVFILSAKLTKHTPSDCFLAILPTGNSFDLKRYYKIC